MNRVFRITYQKYASGLFVNIAVCLLVLFVTSGTKGFCEDASSVPNARTGEASLSLDDIIDKVEERYAVPGFSVQFFQEAILKAIDITDTGDGQIFIKKPGMMRWEYEKPERQIIITDGRDLWIYRPEDNQVMVGKAPSFFGDGKGAGFLSDMTLIRKQFFILPGETNHKDYYQIKLLPKEKTLAIASVNLLISKKTFDVVQVITFNAYGDETRITMHNFQVHPDLDSSLFSFTVPDGADIVQLDE